ncbi:MAG: histidinol-phosphatase HisJ family protein [Ruminococcaceae bacterium]|nr:histidinol-phosphatase HisJ family protein [Oscillospiraceae bacterium]
MTLSFSAPMLQAHRGVAAEYPENTMVAFRAAVRQGYEYIELDPAYTKDLKLVVLHDNTINRTARTREGLPLDEKISINDISYDEAMAYDYGVWLAPKFKDEKIPLLREALGLARDHGVKVKIDNKIERFSAEASEALYKLIAEFEDTVALTSGNADMMAFYAQKFPKAELHYDGAVDEAVLARLAPLGDRLTVWLPYPSPRTSWVTVPFADEALCALVKKHAKLGIWIIGDYKAYEDACARFSPHIVETTGAIKPEVNPGKRYDMHVHSHNSHDSRAPVAETAEVCKAKGLSGFAVTDHLDVQHYHGQDISGHITASVREAEAVAQECAGQIKILRGVEIGEGIWHEDYVKDLLKQQNFDVVLGSVHAVRYKDMHMAYSGIDFGIMSEEDIYGYLTLYFDEVMTMLDTIPCDIVTHLTCPLRYINEKYKRGVDITKYEPQIEAILRRIIDRSLVLEVNTSCDAFYMPDAWIVQKYRDMGGYLVTLGSDAHVSQNLGKSFDEALRFLKETGFRHCYYFENRIGLPYEI